MNDREELRHKAQEIVQAFHDPLNNGAGHHSVVYAGNALADFITEQTRLAQTALIADIVNILENEKKQWLGDPPVLDAINYVIESVSIIAPKPERGQL